MAEDARRHLKTLGLEPGATAADVKQAYRELAAVWHPDRYVNTPHLRDVAQSKMTEINAAYHYLKDHGGEGSERAGAGQSPSSSPGTPPASRYGTAWDGNRARSRETGPAFPPLQALLVLRVALFDAAQRVTGVAISPDGGTILAVSGASAFWWDARSGQRVQEIKAEKGAMERLAVASNGRCVALANNLMGWMGREKAEVRVCDLQTGKERQRFKHNGHVMSLAFSPDGKQLAAGDTRGNVRFWEAESGREVQTLQGASETGAVWRVAYVDGSLAAKQVIVLRAGKALNEITRWEVRRARLLKEYSLHLRECLTYGQIADVVPSPDGRRLLVVNNDRGNRNYSLHLWDVETGNDDKKVPAFQGHADNVTGAAFSPDGRFVASASEDRTVRLWDARTGKETARGVGHERSVRTVAFAPDGATLVTGGADSTVRVWRIP